LPAVAPSLVPERGGLRSAARIALIVGAAGSIVLMMRAGARQRSIILILLFAGWVLSPFLALALANLRASRWPARVRTSLYAAMIGVSALSLAIYGMHAVRGVMKAGFVYLVVPAMAWLLIAVALGANALAARGQR
jgi:hypothetical protein